jgi:hypothetical protein
MKLTDARKIAIRNQVAIRFQLSNGMDCVVDRHGIARVPGLTGAIGNSLEDEFAQATTFWLGTAEVSRTALEQMGKAAPEEAHAADE